jgi:hypothetical protein
MEREKINEWIVRYNEGTLEGEELETFLLMLKDDPDLRKEVRVDQEINRMLEERDLLEFREAVLKARQGKPSGRTGWLLLAAMVLVLASVGGYVIYQALFNGKLPVSKQSVTEARSDSVSSNETPDHKGQSVGHNPKPEDSIASHHRMMLAENFVPLTSLESLVGVVTRADGIIVEKPAYVLNIRQGAEVRFRWNTQENAPVEVMFFDNRGNKILSSGKTHDREYLLVTGVLKQGLYYWKLLKNDQLVTVGKIRIE